MQTLIIKFYSLPQGATRLKGTNAVFFHFGMKAKKLIHASKTIIINHGVRQLIVMTEMNFGITAKVQVYQPDTLPPIPLPSPTPSPSPSLSVKKKGLGNECANSNLHVSRSNQVNLILFHTIHTVKY